MSSDPKGYEKYEWDGVIRHRDVPSSSGWKRWKCRCPGCWVFGQELNRRNREAEQAKRDGRAKKDFKHGLEGYRSHKCRCEVCQAAGDRFNADNRAAGRTRRRRTKKQIETGEVIEETVDWSELAHLRPGHGVRRRNVA